MAHAPQSTTTVSAAMQWGSADAVAKSAHVSVERAVWLLKRQQAVSATDTRMRAKISAKTLGGTWFDPSSGKLVVATKDGTATPSAALADDASVETRTVTRSLSDLDGVKAKIEELARKGRPKGVSWYVDESHNRVTVTVPADATDPATKDFVAGVRALGPAVHIVTDSAAPKTSVGIKDGDEITGLGFPAITQCSAGWWVKDGSGSDLIMTAGHCMEHDGGAWHFNLLRIGGDVNHQVGPHDWGIFHVDGISGPRPTTQINLYNGTTAKISGFKRPTVGDQICKSGVNGHRACGEFISDSYSGTTTEGSTFKDQGLAKMCNAAGDSGGPVYEDDTSKPGHEFALGILSTRMGECGSANPMTTFTFIDDALKDSNTTFVTSTD